MLGLLGLVGPLFLTFLLLQVARCDISWTTNPFSPASFPLAVRSPYNQAWLAQGAGSPLAGTWPTFFDGQIVGWAGFVRVDGKVFSFIGDPAVPDAPFDKAKQTSAQFTATQSSFTMTAGPINVTVSFLSPVEPQDFVKQSLPLSYMAVTAVSVDGSSHSVQVYSDISAEWVSGDPATPVTWNTTTGDVITHSVQPSTPKLFQQIKDKSEYATAYYAAQNGNGTTFQTGADVDVRKTFITSGTLPNTQDTEFRAINSRFPVFAIAKDLGQVTSSTGPAVIAIGVVRDPAVQYITAGGGTEQRSLYFWSQFSNINDAISAFLQDYNNALSRANNFDSQIQKDASQISSDYAAVAALSVRQAFGAMEITIAKNTDGTFNTQDPIAFMKEISSSGNTNTVDVLMPSWPIFLYTNPDLGRILLEALLKYQATGQYPNKFSAHDVGTNYPNATGHNDGKDEAMPIEESGNMLIMALSYAQKKGDNSQLQKYSSLLAQWADFLVANALTPNMQLSTDDFAGMLTNQTNLAIKGIVGIGAMSQIHSLLGDSGQSSNLSSIASQYVQQFQSLATANDGGSHLTLNYGNSSSWGLTYNLYADKLLKLNLFNQSIYDMQTNWYKSMFNPFGIFLDTRAQITKTDWEVWTSAIMSDTATRDLFIKSVKTFAANGLSSQPFGDFYNAVNGKPEAFRARPVVGGHFALLALDQSQLVKAPGTNSTQTDGGKGLPAPGSTSSGGGSTSGTTGSQGGITGTDGPPNAGGRLVASASSLLSSLGLTLIFSWLFW